MATLLKSCRMKIHRRTWQPPIADGTERKQCNVLLACGVFVAGDVTPGAARPAEIAAKIIATHAVIEIPRAAGRPWQCAMRPLASTTPSEMFSGDEGRRSER